MQSGAIYSTFAVKFVLQNLRISGTKKNWCQWGWGHDPMPPKYTTMIIIIY